MASELRVTTIANNAGSESVNTTYVVNGSAKAWVNLNGTGTIAISDSLNHSSATDSATGKYVFNFTNSFGNTSYVSSGLNNHVSPSGNYNRYASEWGIECKFIKLLGC